MPGSRSRGVPTTTPSSTSWPGSGASAADAATPNAGNPIRTGQLAVFGAGDAITVSALPVREQESRSPDLDVLILGGRPIGEPVAWMGPFVMNTREELVEAVRDYHAGRLGTIPAIALTPALPTVPSIHGAPTTIQES